MRKIWIASAVFLIGAFACALQRRDDIALLFAAIGFELVFVADSNIDWKQRLTRGNWRQSIFESRWQTTILGKVSQALGFVCLFLSLALSQR